MNPNCNGFKLGDVVEVRAVFGLVGHQGVVTHEDDQLWVTSNSLRHRCVVEEPIEEFAQDQPVRRIGFLGNLPPRVVVARARRKVGEPWTLGSNCEHFVRWAHGLPETSPQLLLGVLAASLVAFLLIKGKA